MHLKTWTENACVGCAAVDQAQFKNTIWNWD